MTHSNSATAPCSLTPKRLLQVVLGSVGSIAEQVGPVWAVTRPLMTRSPKPFVRAANDRREPSVMMPAAFFPQWKPVPKKDLYSLPSRAEQSRGPWSLSPGHQCRCLCLRLDSCSLCPFIYKNEPILLHRLPPGCSKTGCGKSQNQPARGGSVGSRLQSPGAEGSRGMVAASSPRHQLLVLSCGTTLPAFVRLLCTILT